MPYYDAPTSDLDRYNMMRQTAVIVTESPDNHPLPTDVVTQLNDLLPKFQSAFEALQQEVETRQIEVEQGEEALEKLKMYMRHMWSAMQNRIRREGLETAVHDYYGMTTAGDLPDPTSRQQWLSLAEDMVAGDKRAVSAGYAPASNPSATELETVLNQAQKEILESRQARDTADTALKAVQALRPAVDELIQDIVDAVSYHHRKLTPSQIRNQIRRYGGRFRAYEGEVLDEGEQVE